MAQTDRGSGFGDEAGDDGVGCPGVGVVVYACSSGRLAEEGDAGRITTEGGDVFADPFDC